MKSTLNLILAASLTTFLAACTSDKGSNPASESASPAAPEMAARLSISEPAAEEGADQADVVDAIAQAASQLSGKALLETYQRSCHACHTPGTVGAPKTHDVAAWEVRMHKGMDVLVANAKNGFQAMPPRGLCFDCSDADYAALIEFMATERAL